jgi:hypothetical protein
MWPSMVSHARKVSLTLILSSFSQAARGLKQGSKFGQGAGKTRKAEGEYSQAPNTLKARRRTEITRQDPHHPRSMVLRAESADQTAITRAKQKFKGTDEYQAAATENERRQLLESVKQDVLTKRYTCLWM